MISSFGATYFGNQYILNETSTATLGEVVDGSTKTVTFYNAADVAVSQPLTLDLEDGTFEVTWSTQSTALTNSTELAENPLAIPAHDSETVTIEFKSPGRESAQTAVLTWAGASLTLTFKRLLRVSHKPQGDVSERIEFKTDVSEAWDGTEQRTRLRASARATLSQEFLLPSSDRASAREFQAQAMGLTSRQARVALWHRSQAVTISGTTMSRDAGDLWDPVLLDLVAGDRILIEDPATGTTYTEELAADFTTAQDVTLVTPTATGAVRIVPEVAALLNEDAETKMYPTDAVGFRSRWTYNSRDYDGNALDSSTLYDSLAPETFNGRPILREGNLIGSSLGFSGDSGAIRFDKKIGIIDTFHRRDSSTITFDRMFQYDYEQGKIEALRQFIFWTQGRQRSFYVPSGTEDLFATAVDDTSSEKKLTVMGISLGGIAPILDGYASIEVTLPNGTVSQHLITNSVGDPTTGTSILTYAGTIGDVPTRVEFLYHVRLASDKVQIKYDGRESANCKFKVQTVKQ